jgi:ribosomal protein S18 acetylase RimI-like enzyme
LTNAAITPATHADLHELVTLIIEVEQFYGEDEQADAILRNTERALFGSPPHAYALLARVDAYLVGFAAYSFLWPAVGSTSSVFLKELYVSADYRRHGIGRQLMDELAKIAADHQCSRIEWTTETTNTAAQRFYNSLGQQPLTGKLLYRIDLS